MMFKCNKCGKVSSERHILDNTDCNHEFEEINGNFNMGTIGVCPKCDNVKRHLMKRQIDQMRFVKCCRYCADRLRSLDGQKRASEPPKHPTDYTKDQYNEPQNHE